MRRYFRTMEGGKLQILHMTKAQAEERGLSFFKHGMRKVDLPKGVKASDIRRPPATKRKPKSTLLSITMTPKEMAAAFNRWEREYRLHPDRFQTDEAVLAAFFGDILTGREPTHGELCVTELLRQHSLRGKLVA